MEYLHFYTMSSSQLSAYPPMTPDCVITQPRNGFIPGMYIADRQIAKHIDQKLIAKVRNNSKVQFYDITLYFHNVKTLKSTEQRTTIEGNLNEKAVHIAAFVETCSPEITRCESLHPAGRWSGSVPDSSDKR